MCIGTYSRFYMVTHVMSPEPQNKYLYYIEFAAYIVNCHGKTKNVRTLKSDTVKWLNNANFVSNVFAYFWAW